MPGSVCPIQVTVRPIHPRAPSAKPDGGAFIHTGKFYERGVIKEMTTKKTSRRALLTSVMALVMCLVMLVGTTFAWFTDSVTSGVNTIKSGNLDVKLTYTKGTETGEVTKDTKLFNDAALWEPGHVEYVVLTASNEGSLALKYKLAVNVFGETGSVNMLGDAFQLSSYLQYAVIDEDQSTLTRDQLIEKAELTAAVLGSYTSNETPLYPVDSTEGDSSKTVTLVVWMPTTVGNEANHKTGEAAPTIKLGVSLVATQYTAESDSFGKDYDETAAYPDIWDGNAPTEEEKGQVNFVNNEETGVAEVTVASAKEFIIAAEKANDAAKAAENTSGAVVINLATSIDLSNGNWTSIEVDGYHGTGVLTINGNGKTIYGLNAPLCKGGFAGKSGIVIKNLTIADANIALSGTTGVGAFIANIDSMQTITLEKCTLKNSTVSGERAGGLIGWTSGYNNPDDGPVDTNVTVSDCIVEKCTISATKSAGGIIGHAGANPATYHTIANCTVKDVTLSGEYTGQLIGTANVGQVTANGNTLSSNNTTKYVGRYALGTTGSVTIDGTAYTAE